ncbi:uncharacterized protein LOC130810479 [Amaranthus tricolor]|uniref:uncharacterized protein LOC130810479 n=1 Tax=Amaranthus tricolor TaxID=29722 RepID=UPI0025842C93|nr:uncharacterized protein LOC130810479 [Amaranthus tricolor]XP_057532539.1 uncharacterized protein LOC130810479 [Amaranthus tricolor]XP_057532540.1 uncharacterized protein LOC130810479 [Amaranthus tricolor]
MQIPTKILETFNYFAGISPLHKFPPFHPQFLRSYHHRSSIPNSISYFSHRSHSPRVFCNFGEDARSETRLKGRNRSIKCEIKTKAKGKDNVWSVDNEVAKEVEEKKRGKQRRRRRSGKSVKNLKKIGKDSNLMVSGAMLMEVETVLQTQEPVIRPAWYTFVSSVSGIWKGVGAVFSPITAEMEPIDTGGNDEYLFDCYTLSRVQASQSGSNTSQIQRKTNWVTLNPYGEKELENGGSNSNKGEGKHDNFSSGVKAKGHRGKADYIMPKFENFDFAKCDVMEEDIMRMEPGLVFFEDGSYSRGPVDIPVGEVDESKYYLSPMYRFEQCLVKGCHKRLRIVHTIEFNNGGADIQILRIAVYEEQWVGPANFVEDSEVELDMKPFSQRKRTRPSELTGPWKVFEMSATPIFGDDPKSEKSNGPPFVYLCMETMKNRSLPENPAYFGEEEMIDMQDVAVLWLPGGVTTYVDVNKDGVLCIGVGWYSDEGINLVMERDYETDGKLREVRWKSEVKRRWSESDSLPS